MSTHAVTDLVEVRGQCRDGTARKLREAAGLSLGDVATHLGVSRTTVHLWETGQRVPRRQAALQYSRLLRRLQRASQGAA